MSTGANWIDIATFIVSLAGLLLTAIALIVTAFAVRDAAKQNRISHEVERITARDARAHEALLRAAQKGNPNHGEHLAAIALLVEFPEHLFAISTLRKQYADLALREPSNGDWTRVVSTFDQVISLVEKSAKTA